MPSFQKLSVISMGLSGVLVYSCTQVNRIIGCSVEARERRSSSSSFAHFCNTSGLKLVDGKDGEKLVLSDPGKQFTQAESWWKIGLSFFAHKSKDG